MNLSTQNNTSNSVKDQENTSIATSDNLSDQAINTTTITKQNKSNKFQYINQNVQNWPQWSVSSEEEQPSFQFENPGQKQQDFYRFLSKYNRGMPRPIRMKLMQAWRTQALKINEENKQKPENQKLDLRQQTTKRLKGWRKKIFGHGNTSN